MTTTYDILFRVRISHEYYDRGFSDDFEFVPTPSCQTLLQQLGFIFKPEQDGFVVLAKVRPATNATPLSLFTRLNGQQLRFSFAMNLKNPAFHNITRLSGYQVGKVFYFSNLNNEMDGNNPILRDQVANANLGNPAQLITGNTQNLKFAKPLNTATISVLNLNGDAKNPVAQLALSSADETNNFQINLGNIQQLTPGRYQTTWSGTGSQGNENGAIAFLFEQHLRNNNTIGIIELFVGDNLAIPLNHRFLNGNILEQKAAFQVKFAAHPPVFWQYVIIKNTNNPITPDLAGISIAGFSEQALPANMDATTTKILRSNAKIDVREISQKLTLNTNIPNFSLTLPQPSPNTNLKIIDANTSIYELYIYV